MRRVPRVAKPVEKIKKAARLLLFRAHARPGVKGWELRKALGPDYLDVIRGLNEYLSLLGLEVRAVDEKGRRLSLDGGEGSLSQAIFLVTLREQPTLTEAKTSGWRVDDLAMLSASLLYLASNGGRAPRRLVVEVLKAKFPRWKVEAALDRFIRAGYLREEGDALMIGWRAYAEVDIDQLVGVARLKREEEGGE